MSVDDSMRRTIAEQHDEIGALKAENAKLRERIGYAHMSRLLTENENESLRKLATGLYKCWVNEGCEGCPMQDDGGWCVRDILLRELGVEVDG